jgi:hypothetical protein
MWAYVFSQKSNAQLILSVPGIYGYQGHFF